MKLPASAPFGPADLVADSSSSVPIYVTNTWAQFGDTPDLNAYDPNDEVFANHIGVSAGSFLQQSWSFTAGAPVDGSVDVLDGTAYFADQAGTVYAVSDATGMSIWTTQLRGSPTITSTPAITSTGLVVVTTSGGSVVALDDSTGAQAWTAKLSGGLASPAVAGGSVYVGSTDGTFYALDESTGATRWTFAAGSAISRAATFIGEWVVFGTAGSTDYWLVAKTGDVRWNLPEMGPVAGVAGADGFSVTTDTNGYIRGAKAPTDDWQAWQASQGSDLAAAPAVVNGEVFVAGMNDTINVYTVPGTPAY